MCSDGLKDFLRRLEAETLAGHVLELLRQVRHCFLVPGQERLFLGKGAADAAVEWFDRPALPRMIGFAKITWRFQRLGGILVSNKFQAVIGGNGVPPGFHWPEQFHDRQGEAVGCAVRSDAELRPSGLPFDHGEQDPLVSATMVGVNLPMSGAGAVVDYLWSCGDSHARGKVAAAGVTSWSFPIFFAAPWQVGIAVSTLSAITLQEDVEPGTTAAFLTVELPPTLIVLGRAVLWMLP